ncbi:MAG TPA: DUF1330 domain-containing protein [Casimicrobiaceae bacterium]|nr:DUF1330 domain-containing protein [Casimicrobiaceae bacterium]
MPAYLIARVRVTDPERYREYVALAPEAIARYGGRYLVRGGPITPLEGPEERDRIVVVEFPSMEHARSFWSSPEYEHAKTRRAGAATGQFLLVEGYSG